MIMFWECVFLGELQNSFQNFLLFPVFCGYCAEMLHCGYCIGVYTPWLYEPIGWWRLVPKQFFVSGSMPRVLWLPGMVIGYPQGRMYAAFAATRNCGEARITSIGHEPQWWVAGLGDCGCRYEWTSTRSVSTMSCPNSLFGLVASASSFASRLRSTSCWCCHHCFTWCIRSSMNCCHGLGLGWPFSSSNQNGWSYAVLDPSCGCCGPTWYPDTMKKSLSLHGYVWPLP